MLPRIFNKVVALPGIEPGSGASETHILSIVLQGRELLLILDLRLVKVLRLLSFVFRLSSIVLRLLSFVYFPNLIMFAPKILTAIASRITPKNFLTTNKPFGPKALSIHFREPNTKKITTRFINIPKRIFTSP